ncbi:MAG: two pore domain potassium channel family protein [Planctomycetales bacterium]|nr:two pore domain potassium channel family protein [Planctomycetales bacterium]
MSPLLGCFAFSLIAVLICVGVHYEGLQFASWSIKLVGRRRLRVALGIVLVLMLHVVEVTMFAGGWWVLMLTTDQVLSIPDPHFEDVLYFSFITYTSVGYGDITPVGLGRMLAGTEALIGLVLIAWTASFTFYEMQLYWDPRAERKLKQAAKSASLKQE